MGKRTTKSWDKKQERRLRSYLKANGYLYICSKGSHDKYRSRSGLGFKYQCNLVNGTGIIDCDFINSDNEGHIFIKLVNRGDKEFSVTSNAAIAQGIFLEYGITDDDDAKATRNGGFGSTDKNE